MARGACKQVSNTEKLVRELSLFRIALEPVKKPKRPLWNVSLGSCVEAVCVTHEISMAAQDCACLQASVKNLRKKCT